MLSRLEYGRDPARKLDLRPGSIAARNLLVQAVRFEQAAVLPSAGTLGHGRCSGRRKVRPAVYVRCSSAAHRGIGMFRRQPAGGCNHRSCLGEAPRRGQRVAGRTPSGANSGGAGQHSDHTSIGDHRWLLESVLVGAQLVVGLLHRPIVAALKGIFREAGHSELAPRFARLSKVCSGGAHLDVGFASVARHALAVHAVSGEAACAGGVALRADVKPQEADY